MSQEKTTIQNFTDLRAWQHAHALSVEIYTVTKNWPREEIFGLTRQVRRSTVSVESNIAEAFGRRTSGDRLHFYDMARASLNELQTQLLLARDIYYLADHDYISLTAQATNCHKILSGLIKATKGMSSRLETRNSRLT